jgi:hypothetical protein
MSYEQEPPLPPRRDRGTVQCPELGGRRKSRRTRRSKRRKTKRRIQNSRRRREPKNFRKMRGGLTLLKDSDNRYTIVFSEAEKDSIKTLYKAFAEKHGHGDRVYAKVYHFLINQYINSKRNYGAVTTQDETEIEDLNAAESAGVEQIKMIVTGQIPEL